MREVEVLFDNVLDFFQSNAGLTPKDILVMTPDIEAYAPYITAIFGGNQKREIKSPFLSLIEGLFGKPCH